MYGTGGYGAGAYGGPSSPEELSKDELNDSVEQLRNRVRQLEESESEDKLQNIEDGIEKLLRDNEIDTSVWVRFSVQVGIAVALAEGIQIQPEVVLVFAMFWLAYWSAPSQWER